ncbi:hypothetical protein EVAR_102664_1 [Eumeta japonica]|uniref:Uncharacterized protein n=1 Tax=Eumeta variegata TaxID=151549 RepID=A0A4C1TUW0_EUMVA|nr:hypothetical protein EVAR_102664_1 [Eumeta japonica]
MSMRAIIDSDAHGHSQLRSCHQRVTGPLDRMSDVVGMMETGRLCLKQPLSIRFNGAKLKFSNANSFYDQGNIYSWFRMRRRRMKSSMFYSDIDPVANSDSSLGRALGSKANTLMPMSLVHRTSPSIYAGSFLIYKLYSIS